MSLLVLSLTPEDYVLIGGNIKIQAIRDKGDQVRIYIDAPREIKIDRGLRNVERVNRKGHHPHLRDKIE